jgi:hypothetical protein
LPVKINAPISETPCIFQVNHFQHFLTQLIDQDVLPFHSDLKKYRFLFGVCDYPFHRKEFFEYLLKHLYFFNCDYTYCKLSIFSYSCDFFAFVMCSFNDFNLVDISGIVVSIFAFRFFMSNDIK